MSRYAYASTASVESYLREISRYSLIDRAQENRLARRIHKGDKKALDEMIQANLRLVVKIALEYVGLGLPLPDLISEGNLGLVRAAELFDPKVGAKFSTYAALWIKQRIRRAITNQSKTVRVPIWKAQLLRKIQISSDQMSAQLGRAASELEIADHAGLDADDVARARAGSVQVVSLDAPVGQDEGKETTLSNSIADDNAADPSQAITHREMIQDAQASLNVLSDKELKILAMRFGLYGGEEQTLEAIGAEFQVSRERIRQLQEVALAKLRRRLTDENNPVTDRSRHSEQTSQRLQQLFGKRNQSPKRRSARTQKASRA